MNLIQVIMNQNQVKQNEESRVVLQQSQDEVFPYRIEAFGLPILVYKDVFSPKHFNGWEIFTRNFPDFKGKSILEIGCGTGITSVYLAAKGASKVFAMDINPEAVKNTQANIELKNLTIWKLEKVIFLRLYRPTKSLILYTGICLLCQLMKVMIIRIFWSEGFLILDTV
jgi:methylase of polypeptide subunit release factors